MVGKSAVFAVALALAAACGSSLAGPYPKADTPPAHKNVVVDGMKTKMVPARKHFVVPQHEAVVVRPTKKKVVHTDHKVHKVGQRDRDA